MKSRSIVSGFLALSMVLANQPLSVLASDSSENQSAAEVSTTEPQAPSAPSDSSEPDGSLPPAAGTNVDPSAPSVSPQPEPDSGQSQSPASPAESQPELGQPDGIQAAAGINTVQPAAEEAVKTTITFKYGSNGSLNDKSANVVYENVEEGTQITVPTPTPSNGYQFDSWYDESNTKVDLGDAVTADKENHTWTARFIPIQITITFRVSDPAGASLSIPKNTKYKNLTLNADGSVTWSGTYSRNTKVYFPSHTINTGYEPCSGSTTMSTHWTHGDNPQSISWDSFTLKPEDNGDYYTLVVMPKSLRYYTINGVAADGTVVASSYTKVNYLETNSAMQYLNPKLEKAGYRTETDSSGWTVHYEKANEMEIRDASGTTLYKAEINPKKPIESIFNIPVVPDVKTSTITFKTDGNGTLNGSDEDVVFDDVVEGSSVTVPTPAPKEGYAFAGWTDAEGNPADLTAEITGTAADQVYKATFKELKQRVHLTYFNGDNQIHASDIELKWNEKAAAASDEVHTALAEQGYGLTENFTLAYEKSDTIVIYDGSGKVEAEISLNGNPEQHPYYSLPVKKLYKVSPEAGEGFTVSFEANDSLHQSAKDKGYNFAEGDSSVIRITAEEGYILSGVTVNGKSIDITDPSAVEITLDDIDNINSDVVIKTETKKKQTVKFGDKEVEVVEGEEFTVPEADPVDGREFKGWKAEDGTVVQPGDKIKFEDLKGSYTPQYEDKKPVNPDKPNRPGGGSGSGGSSSNKPSTGKSNDLHRLYNPNSGEHFYTHSDAEKDYLVDAGWKYEGIGWTSPGKSSVPVYRLYNPNAGDHHFTVDSKERDALVGFGWKYEGIAWYSLPSGQGVKVYRQYNPNATGAGSHNYTTSKSENDYLVQAGWHEEGIAWWTLK